MKKFSKWNKGYRYLLMVIDVFSKFGWIVPLKDKTGNRGGVEDTRLEAKDTKKNPSPRPITNFPRTDLLEAEDRNAQGQGYNAQVFSKKKKGLRAESRKFFVKF